MVLHEVYIKLIKNYNLEAYRALIKILMIKSRFDSDIYYKAGPLLKWNGNKWEELKPMTIKEEWNEIELQTEKLRKLLGMEVNGLSGEEEYLANRSTNQVVNQII